LSVRDTRRRPDVRNSIETKSDSASLDIAGCDVNYRKWSDAEPGKKGLLFIHGHNAHSHWWDFIAPSFKDRFQTAAIDLTGMGDSDHRDGYSNDMYAEEIVGVADALNMPEDTIVVAHSFGGMMAIRAFAKYPDRFKRLVLVDSGVRHPDDIEERDPQIDRLQRRKVYPTKEIALSRFRLQPAQQCENQYLVDYIARESLEYDDDGWVWKFDEELNSRMTMNGDLKEDLLAISADITLIYGALSESFKVRSANYMQELVPSLGLIKMADAQHHLFLDQPLAFIDALSKVID
jgi:pimeloyl-ACP methyl ester carboxylesterase